MDYREYPIAEPLRPYIKVLWSMESPVVVADVPPMRILPDSCVELVVHFHDPYITTFSSGRAATQPQSMIVAQMKDYIEILPTGRIGMISVRFSARGAYHFFGAPMKDIANGVTDLKLVWKGIAEEIEERIAECHSTERRIDLIQTYLITQLSENGEFDSVVDYSLQLIYLSKGSVSVDELANKTGLSNRQLLRRFNNKIGVSPKEFSQIIKFIASVGYLRNGFDGNLAQAALACGYYDQAHFTHDFREYAGLTPGEFLASEKNIVL